MTKRMATSVRRDIYTPESRMRRTHTTCCGNCPMFAPEPGKRFSGACLASAYNEGGRWLYECVAASRPFGTKDCCGKVSR